MHYAVLAIVDKNPSGGSGLTLEQTLENHEHSQWDWYCVGGRWTGLFDGYNPETDPRNLEANGKVKWPTEWVQHDGDVMPVMQLSQRQLDQFYAIAVEGWWLGGEESRPWMRSGRYFKKRPRPPLKWLKETFADKVCVVVDCHN
tara:strand:+ start:561 stop:992 length:432 start_codon:yes stop_codon:yes gene_type:complete